MSSTDDKTTRRSAPARFLARLRRAPLHRSRRGSVSMIVAGSAPVLIGFIGFAIDIAMWESAKVGAQAAADQSALAAGLAITKGGTAATEARAVSAVFGFVHGAGGTTVQVNQPPTQGAYMSNAQAVEVVITKPEGPYFSDALRPVAPIVVARSVSAPIGTSAGGGMCVMALEPVQTGLSVNGTPNLDARTCNIYVNSTHTRAVNMQGTSSSIKGYDIFIGGGIRATGGAAVTPTHSLQTYYGTPTADPYAAREIPAFSGCNQNAASFNDSRSFSAGAVPYVFCNGLNIGGSGTVTFGPGIYVIDRGDLNVSGTVTINAANGTTFIVTSSTGSGFGTIKVTGSPTFNVKAVPTGPTAGMAFWLDKRATGSGYSVSGGSTWNITGAYYMPNAAVTWNGSGSSPCTQVVARTIAISGTGELKHDCAGVGVADPPGSGGSTLARLVE